MVRKISGKNSHVSVQHLKTPSANATATSKKDIADTLAKTFANKSSTQNYTTQFLKQENRRENQT